MAAISLAIALSALRVEARPQEPGPASGAAPAMTIEQLAERLQAMEAMNRKLASELERSSREHEAEIQRLRESYSELSKRLDQGEEARPPNEDEAPGSSGRPPTDARAADDTPVPDYTEGRFDPFTPAPGYGPTNAAESRRLRLKGSFSPGFQWKLTNAFSKMMGWGYLFDKRLDYAAGVFNGSRNSFESPTNAVDFVGYFNARPFQESEALGFARFWNIGSSVA